MAILAGGVNPLLHLAVEGIVETVDMGLADGVGAFLARAHIYFFLIPQVGGTLFHYRFALNVIAVANVDVYFVIDANPGFGVHDHYDRVGQVLKLVAGEAGNIYPHVHDFFTG